MRGIVVANRLRLHLTDSRVRGNGGQEARTAEMCSAASWENDTQLHRRQQEDQQILKRSAAQKSKKEKDKRCASV